MTAHTPPFKPPIRNTIATILILIGILTAGSVTGVAMVQQLQAQNEAHTTTAKWASMDNTIDISALMQNDEPNSPTSGDHNGDHKQTQYPHEKLPQTNEDPHATLILRTIGAILMVTSGLILYQKKGDTK